MLEERTICQKLRQPSWLANGATAKDQALPLPIILALLVLVLVMLIFVFTKLIRYLRNPVS